jgi:negative regulator of sigma-B (phosphoserine phosphatase)
MVWQSGPDLSPSVSVAWISRPREGEIVCGDAVIVRPHGNAVLIAVVDALGHGPRAAEVAQISSDWLDAKPESGDGAQAIVQGLHGALHGSRGAAALVLILSARGIEACSVGNVELRSTTGKLPFVLTPGVLGVRLRPPKVGFAEIATERFVLFSDGISGRFDLKAQRSRSPADLASHLFASHRHAHDDASVVVVDVA